MPVLRHTRWLWLVAIVLLAVVAATASAPAAGTPAPRGRLDSQLETLVETLDAEGVAAAAAEADELGVDAGSGEVRVVVETNDDVVDTLAGAGVTVEFRHDDLVQVRAPIGSLETLAAVSGVEQVRVPLRAVPFVTGEGVALTNADDWQVAGVTGAGVKVAIVDLGFAGYTTKLGTELPASVTAMSFRGDGDITGGGQPHGTGVAEIVHEMAPGAQLYLVNFDTEVSLATATAYLDAEGVDVVNASWGYFTSGPGDGTGVPNEVVSDSVADGIFWSVSAGNHATKHWSGQFRDTNSNTFHEFALSPVLDEGNEISGSFPGFVFAGDNVGIELKWDDPYGSACRDYDLYVKRTDENNQVVTVAASENPQYDAGCVPGAYPIETLYFTAAISDVYHIVIQEYFSPTDANFDLYSLYGDVEYVVAANSLGQPGDNPDATTVGAVPYYSPTSIEPFSSRGPTKDGRTKPDVSAPDAVANSTYGNFFGTSAASPHVAGAAALLLDRLPCYSPEQVGATLEANVVDLGIAGKDNTFGAGRLSLGVAPTDVDGDGLAPGCDNCPVDSNAGQENLDGDAFGDVCDPDDDADGFTDAAEIACGSNGADITPPLSRPERLDAVFAGTDDDGDTQVDEALPPGAEAFDCDGDGFSGTAEAHVFASTGERDQDTCGLLDWPADFAGGPISANKLNTLDLATYIAPVRHLNTDVGANPGNVRWDIVPGPGALPDDISILDMSFAVTLAPQMFGGARAFNGPACPWP